jgi:outer membrane protein TolC
LSWELADVQRTRVFQQVELWARNVPLARDASLQMESMYNGGAATALEVLDAYAAWVDANESYADAVLRYRQAEATTLRWGTP